MALQTVIPLHSKDDTWMNRGIVLEFTLHFDDVLDPGHLHRSLARLMEIGEWKKLGARLHLNVCRICFLCTPTEGLIRTEGIL